MRRREVDIRVVRVGHSTLLSIGIVRLVQFIDRPRDKAIQPSNEKDNKEEDKADEPSQVSGFPFFSYIRGGYTWYEISPIDDHIVDSVTMKY